MLAEGAFRSSPGILIHRPRRKTRRKNMKMTFEMLGSVLLTFALAGCSMGHPTAPKYGDMQSESQTGIAVARNVRAAASVKGAGGQMPAFYDGELFTINTLEFKDVAGDHVAANPSHNNIYVTNDLDDPQDFLPVLDAIQGDGFNPLWEQILIVFNPGVTPHQFLSDDEVDDAASGPDPEITLVDTHELYRCSVVGKR
jgi:hypothetical protein